VVGAVASASMSMTPVPVLPGKQTIDRVYQVEIAARSGFDERQAHSGMLGKHRKQPITSLSNECCRFCGQVVHASLGCQLEDDRVHGAKAIQSSIFRDTFATTHVRRATED